MSAPRREIVCGEALAWLAANPAAPNTSVVTSLPDISELPGATLDSWRTWFVDAAARVMTWVPPESVAIFYQSDVLHGGAWIDKGYLVQRAAEREGATLLWHSIVCRAKAGTVSRGRPKYSHMLCFTRGAHVSTARVADVHESAGFMPWSRAMGVKACRVACAYLRDATITRTVVDPFCGRGTVLAIANEMGFDTVGVELGQKRCRVARNLVAADLAREPEEQY